MGFKQIIVTYSDWLLIGGWKPAIPTIDPTWSVITCVTDTDVLDEEDSSVIHIAGSVVWATFNPTTVDPVECLNGNYVAEDYRPV